MNDVVTAATPEEGVGARAWWMLAVLLVFFTLSFIDRSIISMLVQPIGKNLQLTDFEMSIILGPAYAVAFAVFGIPFGWAADHLPRRTVLFWGVFVWALATVACGFATSFGWLFAARVLVGIGEASLTPLALTLIADSFPPSRMTLAMAFYYTGARLGPAAAFLIGGGIITWAASSHGQALTMGMQPWSVAMIAAGAPGMLLAFLAFSFRDPPRRGVRTSNDHSNFRQLLSFTRDNLRLLVLLLIAVSLVAAAMSIYYAWVPTFIERRYHWNPGQYAPLMGMTGLLAMGALLLKGGMVDWLFRRGVHDAHIRFFSWLLFLGLPFPVFMFSLGNPWAFIVAIGLFEALALTYMLYISSTLTLIAPGQLRGQLTAIFLSITVALGSGIGPVVVGFMTTYVFRSEAALGYSLSVSLSGCVLLAFVLLRLALAPLRRAVAAAIGESNG